MQENNNLRKSINEINNNQINNDYHHNIRNNNIIQITSKNEVNVNSGICSTPNIANMNANMKKIEIKQSSGIHSSSKYSPYINKYDENLNNIKNLNAQTALEQQYLNKNGANINVNINNNNSNRRNNSPYNNLSLNKRNIEKCQSNKSRY